MRVSFCFFLCLCRDDRLCRLVPNGTGTACGNSACNNFGSPRRYW